MAFPWFVLQVAATFFMTGIIWFVQVVHYPLFTRVGENGFTRYAGSHARRTAWVVAPVMLVELGTSLLLLAPAFRPSWFFVRCRCRWVGVAGGDLVVDGMGAGAAARSFSAGVSDGDCGPAGGDQLGANGRLDDAGGALVLGLRGARATLATMHFAVLAATAAVGLAVSMAAEGADNYPSAEIANGLIRAKIYLPQAKAGFYQGTRFDWSGVVASLEAHGHNYYGRWFDATDPAVHDFVYRDGKIVAGLASSITGPVDEFGPLGYEAAKAGGTFVKIGVGALRKAADAKYDNYQAYEIVNGGKWAVEREQAGIHFRQEVQDAGSGYGYVYEKRLQLTNGKAEMVMTHRLRNTGGRAMKTSVYNHNFLVLDRQAPGPGVTIRVPYTIGGSAIGNDLAKVAGNEIVYLKTLSGEDKVATPIEGFGSTPEDSRVQIENERLGAGMSWQIDRPLMKQSLWSIRSVLAVEPFVAISLEPGAELSWRTVYEYYQLAEKK